MAAQLSAFLLLTLLCLHFSPSIVDAGRQLSHADDDDHNYSTQRTCPFGHPPWLKRRVLITNQLSGDRTATIHCGSKDNDLGVHDLLPLDEYSWKFRSNNINTLFWCNVNWPENFQVSFNAYDSKVNDHQCSHCFYYIKDDGIWFYDGCKSGTNLFKNATTI